MHADSCHGRDARAGLANALIRLHLPVARTGGTPVSRVRLPGCLKNCLDCTFESYDFRLLRRSLLQLDLAFLQPALADGEAYRNANQIRIRKFESWPRIAVIEERVDAGGVQLVVQTIGDGFGLADVLDRRDHAGERRQRFRPDDPAVVMA